METPSDELELFREYRATGRRRIRNEIVERYMGLAVHIAQRFTTRAGGDDVQQVALLGLVKAVDRFDPELGFPFTAFAGRTIEGEIKRHFRDSTWSVRVPRSTQELYLAVRRGTEELTRALGRAPSVGELAEHLQIDNDDVLNGLLAAAARGAESYDNATSSADSTPMDRQIALASEERGFGDVENDAVVAAALEVLPERERRVVALRFYGGLSQTEIAERVGVSQMHVSRILRRAVDRMREHLDPELFDEAGEGTESG